MNGESKSKAVANLKKRREKIPKNGKIGEPAILRSDSHEMYKIKPTNRKMLNFRLPNKRKKKAGKFHSHCKNRAAIQHMAACNEKKNGDKDDNFDQYAEN
jgi:hypothetical protein